MSRILYTVRLFIIVSAQYRIAYEQHGPDEVGLEKDYG